MSRNAFITLVTNVSIPPSGVKSVYLNLEEADNLQFLSRITTVSNLGVTLDLLYGFGLSDPTSTGPMPTLVDVAPAGVIFGDTKTSIAVEPAVAGTTKGTVFFLNNVRNSLPRWILLRYTNTDPANAAILNLYGDL